MKQVAAGDDRGFNVRDMSEPSASISVQDLNAARSRPAAWANHVKPVFLISLLLCTWLPMAFFLLSSRLEGSMLGYAGTRTLLLFLGTAHVPATLFFYIDKDFSEIIRKHKARYIYFPILLTIATGLLFAFASTLVQAYLLLLYWSWQAFHYGRQNLGIYSFVSIAQRGAAPSKYEKLVIDLGTWCGIVGTFKILGSGVAPSYLHGFFDTLYWAGTFAFVLVLVASVIVYAQNLKRTTTLLTIFYFTIVCFFLPVFLSTNINVAFFSYAIAHGVQYILFMSIVSLNLDPQAAAKRMQIGNAVKLLFLTLVAGFVFYRAGDLKAVELITAHATLMKVVDFIIGAVLGATMAHFVVDAGAWRLSQTLQRMYIGKRFAFVFGQQPKT
jgi:hypothetical protein